MFALSMKNGDDDPTKNSSDEYYMLLVEIKYFNWLIDLALIDNKLFFDQLVKSKHEAYEKPVERSRKDS